MQIVINPGSGPVEGATEEEASKNITAFMDELGLEGLEYLRVPTEDQRGRYGFDVYLPANQMSALVEMPGIPLEQVRFTGEEGQSAWDYPRLYVNGSSWLWKFALNSARGYLSGEHEVDE